MGRLSIAAFAATIVLGIAVPVNAEFEWKKPKLPFWSEKPPARKPANGVQPAAAWFSFDKPKQGAKTLMQAPVDLARRIGDGTRSAMRKTRDVVTSPFTQDRQPRRTKKKSLLSGLFPSRTEPDNNPDSVAEFLRLPRPGID